MVYLILLLLVFAYMIFGLRHLIRNKPVNTWERAYWVILIISFPVLGASTYLRTYFNPDRKF